MDIHTTQLNGWKEIACYFNRSVRCVQRWDKSEGLPVCRHAHRGGASVYANTTDLDEWWAGNMECSKKSSFDKRYDEKLKSKVHSISGAGGTDPAAQYAARLAVTPNGVTYFFLLKPWKTSGLPTILFCIVEEAQKIA